MKWQVKEDEIVCVFYLKHQNDWQKNKNINHLMNLLHCAGYTTRDETSTRMRIDNFMYLHTGHGLSHPAKQSRDVYIRLYSQFKERNEGE